LENIGQKKGQTSSSKKKDHQEPSKEGKKKWKRGEFKKTIANAHLCKNPTTIIIIETLMTTSSKSARNYILS
jgi:hypothetical protein